MVPVLGAVAAAVGSEAFKNIWNIGSQLYQWRREDSYNQAMWNRDDNAVRRRVDDLKAAGLSPVLASGSAAGNSSPSLSSPKNIALDVLAAMQGKANYDNTNAGTNLIKFQSEKVYQEHNNYSPNSYFQSEP